MKHNYTFEYHIRFTNSDGSTFSGNVLSTTNLRGHIAQDKWIMEDYNKCEKSEIEAILVLNEPSLSPQLQLSKQTLKQY